MLDRDVEHAASRIQERARHRAERVGREVAVRGDRMAPHRVDVHPLELALERQPLVPAPAHGLAEHLPELGGEVGAAAGTAPGPLDHLLGRRGQGEVGEEARAVEVGVHADLEVGLGALGLEPERIVDAGAVPHHGAEHHLVPGPLRAAQSAGQPGLEEDRDALAEPAGRRTPREREVAVQHRLRVLGRLAHLSEEDVAEERVPARRLVGRDDVHQLVAHQEVDALVRRAGLVHEVGGGDLDHHAVAGAGPHAGVPVVREVVGREGDLLPRPVPEEPALEGHRVLEAAHRVRRQVLERRAVVDEPQVVGLDDPEERARRGRPRARCCEQRERCAARERERARPARGTRSERAVDGHKGAVAARRSKARPEVSGAHVKMERPRGSTRGPRVDAPRSAPAYLRSARPARAGGRSATREPSPVPPRARRSQPS